MFGRLGVECLRSAARPTATTPRTPRHAGNHPLPREEGWAEDLVRLRPQPVADALGGAHLVSLPRDTGRGMPLVATFWKEDGRPAATGSSNSAIVARDRLDA